MNTKQLVEKLVLWLEERVLAAGCKGIVIGMSGGIDSSVLAVLCHRAFPQNTLGVIIPCFSHEEDKIHALEVADKFSISTTEVVLDTVFTTLLQALPDYKASPATSRLAQANLKARLRMITLYNIANQMSYLVAGSSNKSELSIGYYTKYGDGGVDIIPMGSLVKREITELARFLGIPQSIIDKPPSARLWDGQTDEAEMGFSYSELDHYLLTGEAPDELRKKIESMIAASEHKRSLPPIADIRP